MVPTGVELLALDAALFGFLSFQQVQGEPAQGRQIFRREAGAGKRCLPGCLPNASIVRKTFGNYPLTSSIRGIVHFASPKGGASE